VNNYLTQSNYLSELAKQANVQLQNLRTIKSYLIDDKPGDWAACVRWARLLWQQEFHNQIAQLLHNFPSDATTQDGQAFWSGAKRPPVVLQFDPTDELHMGFIEAAASLRAHNYRIAPDSSRASMRAILATVVPAPFVPAQNAKIATTEAEAKEMLDKEMSGDDHEAQVQAIVDALPTPAKMEGYHLQSIEFEKVGQMNRHARCWDERSGLAHLFCLSAID